MIKKVFNSKLFWMVAFGILVAGFAVDAGLALGGIIYGSSVGIASYFIFGFTLSYSVVCAWLFSAVCVYEIKY